MRHSPRVHLVWVALLAGLLLMQTAPIHADTKQFNPAQPFKAFDLPALDGGRHTLEEFRGRPVILSVWATWCAPCRYELPEFQKARDALAESHPDAVLMTVNLGDGGARAKGFMKKVGLDLPVLLAGKNFVYEYDIVIVPTLWVLDAEGNLAVLHEGWANGTDLTSVLKRDLDVLDRLAARKEAH